MTILLLMLLLLLMKFLVVILCDWDCTKSFTLIFKYNPLGNSVRSIIIIYLFLQMRKLRLRDVTPRDQEAMPEVIALV